MELEVAAATPVSLARTLSQSRLLSTKRRFVSGASQRALITARKAATMLSNAGRCAKSTQSTSRSGNR